ncbi:metallophosphoesterase [Streptomyces sp. NPDC020403]|uniref:metallophosphoesterase n=1 Tax=unclassified Streptomyces TaxID=2593676 RepID=UPI0033FD6CC0
MAYRRTFTAALPALAAALALGATTVSPTGAAADQGRDSPPAVALRLIGVNDFHGHLQPPRGDDAIVSLHGGGSVTAGGGAYLAAHVKQLRRQAPASLVVGTGDLIGVSPPESALFHDEPTIDLMNGLGMAASTTGNHEFEHGYEELERLQHGGCHPQTGCQFDHPYRGARFPYLGANVTLAHTGRNALPPYWIRRVNGVPVGFIGTPLQGVPETLEPGVTAGLRFGNEVEAADRYADLLDRMGIKTIVLLLHQGDVNTTPNGPDTCDVAAGGAGRAIAEGVTSKIDVIFSAHTHAQYVCWLNDPAGHRRPFVQGRSYGRELSVVDLRIDPATREVIRGRTQAFNRIVTRDVPPDAAAQALVDRAVRLATAITGRRAEQVPRSIDHNGRSAAEPTPER